MLRIRRSLAVVAGMKKRMTTQNRQKSNAKKKQIYLMDRDSYLTPWINSHSNSINKMQKAEKKHITGFRVA